jgi:hypothetical protein
MRSRFEFLGRLTQTNRLSGERSGVQPNEMLAQRGHANGVAFIG